jgi:hypothetical protein
MDIGDRDSLRRGQAITNDRIGKVLRPFRGRPNNPQADLERARRGEYGRRNREDTDQEASLLEQK